MSPTFENAKEQESQEERERERAFSTYSGAKKRNRAVAFPVSNNSKIKNKPRKGRKKTRVKKKNLNKNKADDYLDGNKKIPTKNPKREMKSMMSIHPSQSNKNQDQENAFSRKRQRPKIQEQKVVRAAAGGRPSYI